ncbi:hypothetical protein DYH10_00520 [Candidatus Saccharibacteria bacterium CPR2]|nr:hypothetical protein [Candidatus Saccharibacteria bacterium CPR2]
MKVKTTKKNLKSYFEWLGKIKTWQIILLFIASAIVSLWLLRQNSLKTIELREKVLAADEKNEGIEEALEKLGGYIFSHMNSNIPPVELRSSYDRAVQKARKEATESSNSQIYQKAQEVCENPNIPLTARAQCIQDYVTSNASPGSSPDELKLPPKELYVYDFHAPLWSPDVAGISSIITIILAGILVSRFIAYAIARQELKNDG